MPHLYHALDYTVEVYIVYQDKVLLRKHDKYGIWLSVGGHIELGEDPIEAAKREVEEEVGLKIKLVSPMHMLQSDPATYRHLPTPAFMNRHKVTHEHEHIAFVYFGKATQFTITQGVREKSVCCQWFSYEELEALQDDISSTVKSYAMAALDSLMIKKA